MFPRDFRTPKEGKSKSIFEFEGRKGSISGACAAAFLGGHWGLHQALWGVLEGFRSGSPASLQIRAFGLSLCNRFPSLPPNFRFKGILRGVIWVYRV